MDVSSDTKHISLNGVDAFDLLNILLNYIDMMQQEINQAEVDRKSGKGVDLFDNWTDFQASLDAGKEKGKRLLKDLQRQTGQVIISEEAIDRL